MSNATIKAGIVGGAGYTGGEMLRILLNHPEVDIVFIHSRSNAGEPVYKIHTDLIGSTDLVFSKDIQYDIDVLFLCVGHGEANVFLETNNIPASISIIDLSQDFRIAKNAQLGERTFVYGLPEMNREIIKSATSIANPGCFATCVQLGLLPLAKAGILDEVQTTGITGATGAGQKLQASAHFAWRANNIEAYKSLDHQHLHEILQTISNLQPNHKAINFIPWRGDFTRGIYVSSHTVCNLNIEAAYALYESYYNGHPFTYVSREMIDMKQVVNTNKALIHLEKVGDRMVIHSTIDNLLKGASGQAVQNMNLMFGLPEHTGLQLKANAF
jgi:N-acetyl-gamma-glutamyl-phosphate reductase